MMKRFLAVFTIIALFASIMLGIFACKNTNDPSSASENLPILITTLVNDALPNGEDNQAIAESLSYYLNKSETEDADAVTILRILDDNSKTLGAALTAIHAKEYDDRAKTQCRDALSLIAGAVSADVAGDIYFAIADDYYEVTPFTRSDCRKVANLYFTFYADLGQTTVAEIFDGNIGNMTEREVNTLLISLASSLRSASELSDLCKNYFRDKLLQMTAKYDFPSELPENELSAATDYYKELINAVFDGYGIFITYLSRFAANASAELFLGIQYAEEERTAYYGYNFDDWTPVNITEEEYLAKTGSFDTYYTIEKMMKGYYADNAFHAIPEDDLDLAQNTIILKAAYKAYSALSENEKRSFHTHFEELLTVGGKDEIIAAAILGKDIIEKDESVSPATFDELISAIAGLADFDSKDGISPSEHTNAVEAITAFDRYMHWYFPDLY